MQMISTIRTIVLVLLGTTLLLSSCSPSKYCARKFPPIVDTIVKIDTVYHERVQEIRFPPDTAYIIIPRYELDKSGSKPVMKVKLSKRAKAEVKVDSTGIFVRATCAEQDSVIKILEAEIRRGTTVTSVQHIPVKYIPKFYKASFYWMLMSIPALVLWIIWKLRRFFTII